MLPTLTSNGVPIVATTSSSLGVVTSTFSMSEGTVTFGNYTFTVNQLGHLLSILLAQHPEVSL